MSRYAIVVGINHYTPVDQKGLKTLTGAINDATAVKNWITTYGGVTENNCYFIPSTEAPLHPVRRKIDEAIVEIYSKVQAENGGSAERLYFYFAGHGLAVEVDKENNGLCMADWNEDMADSLALSSKEYKQKFLAEGLFKEIVIWMDCCRNTKLYFNPLGAARIVPGIGPNSNPKWMMGFATQYQNEAFEASAKVGNHVEPRGIFTKVLLDGLNGAASETGGLPVSVIELTDYLTYHVPLEAQYAGFSQLPEIIHNTSKFNSLIF